MHYRKQNIDRSGEEKILDWQDAKKSFGNALNEIKLPHAFQKIYIRNLLKIEKQTVLEVW